MKFSNWKFLVALLLLFVLSVGFVSASDNTTDIVCEDSSNLIDVVNTSIDEDIETSTDFICENISSESQDFQFDDTNLSDAQAVEKTKITTKINANKPSFYYTQKGQLVGYLKDNDNHAIKNKKISIFLNGKTFTRITDGSGKVILKLNIVPNNYNVKIKFMGDENYSSCQYNTLIKIKKLPISLNANNYRTYWKSDLFFKAKVCDKLTKKPISGIKVLFKIYSGNSLYLNYYSTTDKNGLAYLDKNLDVGDYEIRTYICNKKGLYSLSDIDEKATLKILPTAEVGCCSYYAKLTNDEFVSGFRRDSTYAADLYIQTVKWFGRAAVKQYKLSGSYFFHMIVTSDGWAIGTGGSDNPGINNAIENIAGSMVQSNSMPVEKIRTIMGYLSILGIGHFAIKNPSGKYVVAWKNTYRYGQLNPGDYISVPNVNSYFRKGKCSSFGKYPAQIGVKIAATDYYGINRRDITAYYWKAITNAGSTEVHIGVYAANDNGKLLGRSSTAYLRDNIYFGSKYISKYKLPIAPSSKYLGTYKFGNIDKLTKTFTVVSAPKLTKSVNESKTFDITVKNKKTGKAIPNLSLKIKISNKVYTVRTNSNGVANFNASILGNGTYSVKIYSGNIKYYVMAKSTISIV